MSPLVLVLCAAPVAGLDARFLLTIDDEPWAELRVRVTGRQYHYDAVHFFDEGDRTFSRVLTLDSAGRIGGLQPEVLALLAPPATGCRKILEERSGQPEQLCVEAREGSLVWGQIDGVPFSARYEAGTLREVTLPGVRWERVGQAAKRAATRSSPFVQGFAVTKEGPRLSFAPQLEGAVEVEVVATGRPGEVDRLRCLVLARRAARADPGRQVVTGLIVEGARAFAHAWVKNGDGFEDPSRLPQDRPGRYLLLPSAAAGRVYLELLEGSRSVVRAEGR